MRIPYVHSAATSAATCKHMFRTHESTQTITHCIQDLGGVNIEAGYWQEHDCVITHAVCKDTQCG